MGVVTPRALVLFLLALKDWLPFALVVIVGILVGVAVKYWRR
jgi:hypothetical protein